MTRAWTAARALRNFVRRLARDGRGATAVEYGFILALVVLAMVASLKGLAGATVGLWNDIASQVTNAR